MSEWLGICKTAIANAEAAEDPKSCITFHHFPGYCECAFNRERRLAGRLARFVKLLTEHIDDPTEDELDRLWQESE
jgi:hypothetical protein